MLRSTFARRIANQDVVYSWLRSSSRLPSHHLQGIQTNRDAITRSGFASSATADPSHNSLSSFLCYAKRTSLDHASTTFAGTYYEYATQERLRSYGFDLTRVGGRGDRGVDLKGSWTIATEGDKIESKLQVIVQCKRLRTKVGPNLIRELEGALAGRSNTLGVLVGTKSATKGVRDAMGRSKVGICWIMLEVEEGENQKTGSEDSALVEGDLADSEDRKEHVQTFDGILQTMKDEIVSKVPRKMHDLLQLPNEDNHTPPREEATQDTPSQLRHVRQMLWNRAASSMGLEGLDVVTKYDGTKDHNGEVGKDVMLMRQGKKILEQNEPTSS